MFRAALLTLLIVVGQAVNAAPVGGQFTSIYGGELALEAWRGQPVLVVNTASRCGYTKQYADLQTLYDRYRDRGLVVLAVPSNDFKQELADEAAVKDFCELNYDLDLPMTEITSVKGAAAHPFYQAVRTQTGFQPRWNFNKILISPAGEVVEIWGARTKPTAQKITRQIEAQF